MNPKRPFIVVCYICDRTINHVFQDKAMDAQHTRISPRVDGYLRSKGQVKRSTFPCRRCRTRPPCS